MAEVTDEKRDEIIQIIAEMMRHSTFTFELKVVKKPKGIRVISEITQEEMDEMLAEQNKVKE